MKKVGLALGSGGSKGIAHLGVLKVLDKYKIPIDMIAGTSIGAVIGAMYSAQPNVKKIEQDVYDMDWKSIFDYTIPKKGLLKGDKIEQILEEKLGRIKFSQLKIPLYITSYDLEKNQEVIFHKGDVIKAIRSSIAIPGVFIPCQNDERVLIDGGIFDPIPTEILKKAGAEIIIAVNVNQIKGKPAVMEEALPKKREDKIPNIIHTVVRSFQIIEAEAAKADLEKDKADLIINIDLEDIGPLDFSKNRIAIKKGEAAAIRSIKKIENLAEPNLFKSLIDELRELGICKFFNNLKKVGEEIDEKTDHAT